MRAVLRLVLTYFTGTTILRWTTALGLACGVGGWILLLSVPPLVAQNGLPSRFSLWQEAAMTLLPVAGVLAFAFGASLLPTLVTALARGHYLYVLPFGRIKVLASVFVTITLIAAFASSASVVFYLETRVPLSFVVSRSLPISLVTYSLVYVVLWLMTTSRNAIANVLGAVAIIGTLMLPLRYINTPSLSVVGVWIGCAVLWGVFATAFMLAPQLKSTAIRCRRALAERMPGASYRGGAALDLVLGASRVSTLVLTQVVAMAVATTLLPALPTGYATHPAPSPWLFFITLLSVLAAAPASFAATRSRSLWLRAGWTRSELFARVERAFWRHGAYSAGIMSLGLVVVGHYFALPSSVLAFGVGLVVLGTAISTYLGLMITATITWTQTAIAVAALGLLLRTAYYAAGATTSLQTVLALEAGLGVAALALRALAQRNWRALDWMRCRSALRVRAAS